MVPSTPGWWIKTVNKRCATIFKMNCASQNENIKKVILNQSYQTDNVDMALCDYQNWKVCIKFSYHPKHL